MGYNRENFLKRVLRVQSVVLEKQALGITKVRIYEDYIKDVFLISVNTMYRYLSINARRELRLLEEAKKLKESESVVSSEVDKPK